MKEQKERRPLPQINDRIRAVRVQLIMNDGENIGIVSRTEALRIAEGAHLDLVLLSETGGEGVPVVKVMDFGKALYEKKKQQAKAKKHQKVIQVKEIKLRPKIGGHDFETKMKQALDFLKEGKRVKVTVSFRGRENILRDERGNELFGQIDEFLDSQGIDIAHEQDSRIGQMWSRVYYMK